MSANAIVVQGLTKRFEKLVAVDNISFQVREGEIFGFLGPNGAGKTTTINMLTTIIRPTGGTATVSCCDINEDPRGVRRTIGLVPQEYTADEDLTGMENILLTADLYGVPKSESRGRARELLELVHLSDAANRNVETYSGGMRRRLELACGLINRPKVLFLDEPTLGLDVQTRTAVWEYIRLLKDKYNMTLFMTTHYLEEADHLCERIAIIDHGRIVALDTPTSLKASLGGDIIEMKVEGAECEGLVETVKSIPTVKDVKPIDSGCRMKVANGEETAPQILEILRGKGLKVSRLSISSPTLDEVYLDKTGRTMREEESTRDDVMRQRFTVRRARQ